MPTATPSSTPGGHQGGGDVDNVIELPALSAGTYRHNSSMGMYAGRISVIQPPKPAS
jgi:hypothetical protein